MDTRLCRAYEMIAKMYEDENLTPDNLKELALSPKWAVVAGEGKACGAAFRFGGEHAVYGHLYDTKFISQLQPFVGKSLFALTEYLLKQEDLYMRAFCVAALNALSNPLLEPRRMSGRGWETHAPCDLFFLRPEDTVVCVGYGMLLQEVLTVCGQVHVSDMRPIPDLQTTIVGRDVIIVPEKIIVHRAEENPELLARADVVLLSGCTIVNDTWGELIRYAVHARIIGMFGPSAQIVPEFLARNGIGYVTASRITDSILLRQQLCKPLGTGLSPACTAGYAVYIPNFKIN